MGIFAYFRDSEKFAKCESIGFENEDEFRAILLELIKERRDFPLPISSEGKSSSILSLIREFPVTSGSIDLLGIDSEGFIYTIETKLYRSSERRKTLAQVIDYASDLWSKYSKDPDLFIEKLKERSDFNLNEGVIRKVKDNIRNGRLRFIIAMDYIDKKRKILII